MTIRRYIASMPLWLGVLIFTGTIIAMEGLAYAAHRWLMHGPGWFLHRSHHAPRTGRFELNDLYALIFAGPSILLILGGYRLDWGEWAAWAGWGIAAYGAIYAVFHDVIVHKRLDHRYVPRGGYMKRITQAHRLHHAVETREDGLSFGFLVAPAPEALKAELAKRGRKGVRAPTA